MIITSPPHNHTPHPTVITKFHAVVKDRVKFNTSLAQRFLYCEDMGWGIVGPFEDQLMAEQYCVKAVMGGSSTSMVTISVEQAFSLVNAKEHGLLLTPEQSLAEPDWC